MAIKGTVTSKWEDQMVSMLEASTSYQVVRELRFHVPEEGEKQRRWKFDAAIPELMVAIEMEGGTWSGGRHIRPAGYEADCEKYNTATLQGWDVYRLVPRMLNQGWIEKILSEYQ